jgi:RsiW-degrading membrane proteinase PrsW (M82 family)
MTPSDGIRIQISKPVGTKVTDWISISVPAALILYLSRPWEVMEFSHFLLLAFNASFVFFLLWWSDRYEREKFSTILWALGWGAFPACLLSILFESFAFTTVSGSFIEEIFKLAGLLIVFRRGSINSWMDGLIIGGFIGLGFAVIEDVLYAISDSNIFETIFYRGLFSIFAHTFFSGVGAVIMVFGLLSRRIWLTIIGFMISFTLHLLWNTILDLGIDPTYSTNSFIFFAIVPPVVVIILAIFLRINEKNELKKRGIIAVSKNLISQQDLNLILVMKHRRDHIRQMPSREEKREFKNRIYSIARKILTEGFDS